MVQKYKCGMCDSKPYKIGHHKYHLETQKHKDKRNIVELQLKSMTNEELKEKYSTDDMNEIINKIETKIIIKVKKKEETNMDISKKHRRNTIIFEGLRIFFNQF